VASTPRIGTHANEMHVTDLSWCDESEEVRRHASALVMHDKSRIAKLVNEHWMMPGTHVALAPVLGERVDDGVVVGSRSRLEKHRRR
jgi:hypothetical protein